MWNTEIWANFCEYLFIIISIIQGTLISVYMILSKAPQSDRNIMWVTYVIKNFLVATLKKLEETCETDFNNIC